MKIMQALAVATVVGAGVAAAADAPAGKTWIELRKYTFASVEKRQAFEAYLAQAAIPALNRAGVKPVGALTLSKEDNPKLTPAPEGLELYLVLPHPTADSVAALAYVLDRDAAYRAAGKDTIEAPRTSPAYVKVETALLTALDKMPKVEVPSTAADRVLQLRIYTGHNDERALRKMEMFDLGGEIEIFRRTGLNPVFFGRALAGPLLPNTTYMLGFDSTAAQAAAWKAFREDAEWNKLKADPRFNDCEPSIVNLILRPTAGSQL